jgi:hypothetical protein
MTREVEAIFEDGVFKPVEPVSLNDKQRVKLRVTEAEEAPASGPPYWKAETAWIGKNAHLYRGQWVALWGAELLSHGLDGDVVRDEALRKGVDDPLMYHVPLHLGEPSIEWL